MKRDFGNLAIAMNSEIEGPNTGNGVIQPTTTTLRGWGGHSVEAIERNSEDLLSMTKDISILRGLGRSYGDSSLPHQETPVAGCTTRADRILSFNDVTGELQVEAGLRLQEINRLFLPKKWFTPVTPGTQMVTVGGMVAADVHGKNHHSAGSFGQYVTRLQVCTVDGQILWCGPDTNSQLFWATIGGMGLTGHILAVCFRMKKIPSAWIRQTTQRIANLSEFIDTLHSAGERWPYTVGWIDCLSKKKFGRGILTCGDWASEAEVPSGIPSEPKRPSIPFYFPSYLLNSWSVRAFNEMYFRRSPKRPKQQIVNPYQFFYPLDAVGNWNRIYGRRGFTQYQCVVPTMQAKHHVGQILQCIAQHNAASFLCVIKDMGAQGQGILSFPMPGVTVAIDLPIRDGTKKLIARLNQLVVEAKGRIYLAKDSFTTSAEYKQMDPRIEQFTKFKNSIDPDYKIRSAQSSRILENI